jgi:hypothetical protein
MGGADACRLVTRLPVEAQVAARAIELAVGTWHLLPHRAHCQVMYNPHYMAGTGLTAGDCIEHIWSNLRKFNNRLAYMGDAHRQDMLSMLVSAQQVRMWQQAMLA